MLRTINPRWNISVITGRKSGLKDRRESIGIALSESGYAASGRHFSRLRGTKVTRPPCALRSSLRSICAEEGRNALLKITNAEQPTTALAVFDEEKSLAAVKTHRGSLVSVDYQMEKLAPCDSLDSSVEFLVNGEELNHLCGPLSPGSAVDMKAPW